jgi:hypothetical protein
MFSFSLKSGREKWERGERDRKETAKRDRETERDRKREKRERDGETQLLIPGVPLKKCLKNSFSFSHYQTHTDTNHTNTFTSGREYWDTNRDMKSGMDGGREIELEKLREIPRVVETQKTDQHSLLWETTFSHITYTSNIILYPTYKDVCS